MQRPLSDSEDAFGHALVDCFEGKTVAEFIERSDGFIDVASRDVRGYFAPFADWSEDQRAAAAEVRGRTLDVGCGAGRFLLHLQNEGREVVGIDVSPLALEVCRRRGARDVRLMSLRDVDRTLGVFDSVILMGNNFGIFGNPKRAKRLLRRLHRLTSPSGRIIAEALDPYQTDEPFHLAMHEENRRRGRMPGQVRVRVRYKGYRTPWFDLLLVSQDEMAEIIADTGWHVAKRIESGTPTYITVLEKD